MIGIVIVSHSAKLAEGVVELASAMGGDASRIGDSVRIQAVGGLNLPNQPLGTDPLLILDAIEAVYSEDGVLVLMDLGSAILSAEMALEMLPEDKRARVLLCEAPIVEGAVVAAVQARIGSSLEQAAAEARGALASKAGQLNPAGSEVHAVPPEQEASSRAEKNTIRLTVRNRLGLHARPAARLVKIAGAFPDTDLKIKNLTTGGGPVSARSINAVASLGVLHGHEILISAVGPDAQASLAAIQSLAEENFGDMEQPDTQPPQMLPILTTPPAAKAGPLGEAKEGALKGLPASAGISMGPARVLQPVTPSIPMHLIDHPENEWAALQRSIDKTRSQTESDFQLAQYRLSAQEAEIFEVHLLILADEKILAPARSAIFDQKLNAAAAWQQAIQQVVEHYHRMPDPYLRMRAKDVDEVGQQVLVNLLGLQNLLPEIAEPCILVASDLTVAEVAHLDPKRVMGICTASGGAVSHAVVLIRSLGIPAVTGLGGAILRLANQAFVIVDGDSGLVWIDPLKKVREDYSSRIAAAQSSQSIAHAESQLPAVTRDGHRVEVGANVGSVKEIQSAVMMGAEGIGLFRTEFLFLDRQTAPNENEQFEVYRASAEALAGRPLIIRTLDAGGDKRLPYLNIEAEENPFLGCRAIRLSLAQPELFKTQLRAILRVAADHPVKIMFPMIATLSEWHAARALLQEAKAEVKRSGQAAPDDIQVGMMVEIPAAAIKADQFAQEVDFFSIGTNDLAQYTLAAERGNPRVAALSDPFHPAILELIQKVIQAAHAQGKWVGVCGEMAADPLAVPLLVGLSFDELSLNSPGIPQTKQIIRSLEYEKVKVQAAAALTAASAEAAREVMRS